MTLHADTHHSQGTLRKATPEQVAQLAELVAQRFPKGGRPPEIVAAAQKAMALDAQSARFVIRAAFDKGLLHTDSHFALHPGRHPNSL
jgi:hypothetical protein